MFTLDQVVPWGRSFDEYARMFALTEADLRLSIVGCGDGPASFNAEATRRGVTVISCDPIYKWSTSQLRDRIADTYAQIIEQTRQNEHEFLWDTFASVEELGRARMSAMQEFLDDYDQGKAAGRYIDAALPQLPFANQTFGLALCSHFLFLYTEQLGEDFHHAAVEELLRIAAEVRIFPLLALGSQPSRLLQPVVAQLRGRGRHVTIEQVPYEFQRGGNKMLRIR